MSQATSALTKIPIACFVGWSNTGKTTFIEACAAELSSRGIPVGTAKCVRHPGSFNLPGKDSSRFFQAGAESALISEAETLISIRTPAVWDRPFLARLFPEARVVLVEGHVFEGAVRVLVGGSARDEGELKQPLKDFEVLVTNQESLMKAARQAGLKVFAPEQFRDFTDSCLQAL